MTEVSRPWQDGAGDGGPYSADQWDMILETLGLATGANVGVVPGILNELAVTSTGDNNITVNTGRAQVKGTIYENGASESKTTSSPTVGTTGRRCVLRKDWSARTVRIAIISSADGVAALPALTQTDGVTWEIPLASFTITTAGVIGALTSEREWTDPDRIVSVRKAAIETVNNSAALQDDDDFSFAIGANEVWVVEIHGGASFLVASDFQFTFALPASATMLALGHAMSAANALGSGSGSTPGTGIDLETAATATQFHVYALVANAGTAGTAQFRWAQRVAVAEDTSVLANSYMIARRIA